MGARYLGRAANRGYAPAQYVLGTLGLKCNRIAEAWQYLQMAAAQEQRACVALHDLFVTEVLQNKNAALVGYIKGWAETNKFSAFYLGQYYKLVEKNEKLAFHYYKLAADQGLMGAYFQLGALFEEHSDFARAVTYYKCAAKCGFRPAVEKLNNLNISY